MSKVNYYVVLDDGETYSALDGCKVVGISSKNKAATRALDEDDLETALELADLVAAIEVPASASK